MRNKIKEEEGRKKKVLLPINKGGKMA